MHFTETNSMDTTRKPTWLRAKLPSAGVRIVTVRGAGYRLEEE